MESYWDFIEPYWDIFDIYNGPEAFERSISGAPRSVTLLYAAHFCKSEVDNGGILQFFWNSTGILAPEAAEGYSLIGMPTLASLVSEAAALLGSPYPRNRRDRWNAMLIASGHPAGECERIFEGKKDPYRAFAEAVKTFPLDPLNQRFWQVAESESGGFEEAATRFAQSLPT
jgi:hypothetical protein